MSQGRDNHPLPAVNACEATDPERSGAVEEKRRAARRRFLLGGASALPVIVSVTPVGAKVIVAPLSICTSLGGKAVTPDTDPPDKPPPGDSLACELPP